MKKFFSILLTIIILATSVSVCASGDLDVTGVSATEISKLAGEITATFTGPVNPDTLKGRVTLACQGVETPVKTEVLGNDVKVSYGDLQENKTYMLTFARGIKSADGSAELSADKSFELETNISVYRVKEDFQGYAVDAEYSAKTSGLADGEMYHTGSGTIKSNNGYNYVEYGASANTLLGDHYLNGNSSSPLITEDFAIDFEFQDVAASTGVTGRNFTIAPDTYANDANGNNNSFTIMPSSTEIRTKLQLANTTVANPKIIMATSQPTELNLYQNEYGFNTVKIAGHMGSDNNFDLELSSENAANPNNSIKVDFTKFESYGSFRSRIQAGKTNWGKMYVYKITPIGVLDTYTDSEYLYVVMNDDIAKFSATSPVFTKANYIETSRTFKVSLADLEEGDQTYSYGDLRTDDGAFGGGSVEVYVKPSLYITTSLSDTVNAKRTNGQLRIAFNKKIDESTLSGNIGIKLEGGADDQSAAVGLSVSVDEGDPKVIVIAWEELEANQTYVLTLNGSVDGTNAIKAQATEGDCWLEASRSIKITSNTKLNVVTDVSAERSIGRIDGSIEVEFDKELDANTLSDNVYLTKAGSAEKLDIVVAPGEQSAKVVTVSWEELGGDETYILTFVGSLSGENCIKATETEGDFWLQENVTLEFDTDARLEVDGIVKDSYSVGKVASNITLAFDKEIDEASLEGSIRLRKEGGADVTDLVGVTASVDESNPKAIVVSYGELEDDITYILTLKGSTNGGNSGVTCIKSPDAEYWLHTDKTIKIVTDINIYQQYTDKYTLSDITFDDYTVGAEFSSDDPNLLLQSTFETTTPSTKDLHVASVSSGKNTMKYIRMGTDGTIVRDSFFGYKFPTAVTDKELAVDITYRVVGTPASRSIRTGSVTIHSIVKDPGAATDEFGFSHIRYVFTKAANGKYVVNGYDMLKSLDVPIVTKDTGLTSIADVKCQQYEFEANLNSGRYFDIAGFKVSEYASPKVDTGKTEIQNLPRNMEEVIVTFTVPVVRTSITKDSIKIVDSNREEVAAEAAALPAEHLINANVSKADTLAVKIVLKEYLTAGDEYTIKFSNLESILGYTSSENDAYTFTAGGTGVKVNSVTFKDGEGKPITQLTEGDTAVSATVNLLSEDGENKDVRVFLALYDENGMIYKLSPQTGTADSEADDITVSLSGIAIKKGCFVKCFVWQDTSDGQRVALFDNNIIKCNSESAEVE